MALADLSDLQSIMSVTDDSRATTLLERASATVVMYTGQTFERATTTDRFRVRRGHVKLSQRPVNDVTAVVDKNANPISFEWDMGDRVKVASNVWGDFAFEPWTSSIQVVDVTYDHGYDTIPEVIIDVVCQIAGRAYGTTPDATALNQETLGAYNYSTGAAAASGTLGLLAGERAALDKFRRLGGTVGVDR